MKFSALLAPTVLALIVLAAAIAARAADPVEIPAFLAIPRPAPGAEVRYGPAQPQGVDVFLPSGAGPHPVAILVHGGCWFAMEGAGREQLRHLCQSTPAGSHR